MNRSAAEAKAYRHPLVPVTMLPVGGRWHVRFQIGGRRRKMTTREALKNRRRAEDRATELYDAALAESRGLKPKEPCPTLAKAFEMWVERFALEKSETHVSAIARVGKQHLGALADVLLKNLDTAQVEDEMGRFKAKGYSHGYVANWLEYVRLVTNWFTRRGTIPKITIDILNHRIKEKSKPLIPTAKVKQWLDEVDFSAAGEPSIALILRLQIGMGLRGAEARCARWEWLDMDRALYTPGETKGGKAWARPVPEWILDYLRPLAPDPAIGFIAPTKRGKLVSPFRIKAVFDEACKRVGLPKMTPHRLRATYATWLSEEGVPIQDIQAALEHKDIRTTALYLGTDLGRVAAAQARIAKKTGLTR